MPALGAGIGLGNAHLGKTGKIDHTQRGDIGNRVPLPGNIGALAEALFQALIKTLDAGLPPGGQFGNGLDILQTGQPPILKGNYAR